MDQRTPKGNFICGRCAVCCLLKQHISGFFSYQKLLHKISCKFEKCDLRYMKPCGLMYARVTTRCINTFIHEYLSCIYRECRFYWLGMSWSWNTQISSWSSGSPNTYNGQICNCIVLMKRRETFWIYTFPQWLVLCFLREEEQKIQHWAVVALNPQNPDKAFSEVVSILPSSGTLEMSQILGISC